MGELTHAAPVEAVKDCSSTRGDAGPLVNRRLAAVALDPASATGEGILPRLALWLAEVSAEAALTPLQQPEPAADQASPGSSPE